MTSFRWERPANVIDLYAEFRVETNGLDLTAGRGLLGALLFYGLPCIGGEEKQAMRELILSGGPWSAEERAGILDYCQSDVDALCRLLPAMVGSITTDDRRLEQALFRGRYMDAVAAMEWRGVPIDGALWGRLCGAWDALRQDLIHEIDKGYGVYDGLTFKRDRFAAWLAREGIPWPQLESGELALDDDTFRQMANTEPQVQALRELRHSLSELRLNKLAIGQDGRNRTLVSPFASKTGRNQPSNAKFVFGPSRWVRGLIKPEPGTALAYLDWSSQEVAIAAALSGDPAMIAAYQSGDVYLTFAKQTGLAPPSATKETHKAVRERCKTVVLGTLYGMQARTLAQRLSISEIEAQDLLDRHRLTYRRFWEWSQSIIDTAMFGVPLEARLGWKLQLGYGATPRPTSLMNWPMQSNGAEMMRVAATIAVEEGLGICAPIHDALLLEAPADQISVHVERLRSIMGRASELILDGVLSCKVDTHIVCDPNRYMDERGAEMWDRVMGLLDRQGLAA